MPAGLQGANGLGENSLSECLVFGKRAGEYAERFAQENGCGKIDAAEVDALAKAALEPLERDGDGENPYEIQRELQEMMQDKVGIIREDRLMKEAIDDIAKLAQRQQMSKAYTNNVKRLSIELPERREHFLQRGFLDVVLQFKAAGLDPAQLTVSRIDTSKLTDQYQGIAMRGGPLTIWFAKNKTPLDITLTLVVADVPHHGWVFVQDPKLNVPPVQGPAELPPGK